MNIQGWFPLGLTGLISFLSKGLSRVFSSTTVQKHQLFSPLPSLWSNFHIHTWLLRKPQLWINEPLLAQRGLLFNTLSRFVTAFLPRSMCLICLTAVTIHSNFGGQENKICYYFHFFPSYLPWSDGTRCHGFIFGMLSFEPPFSLSSFMSIKRLFSSKDQLFGSLPSLWSSSHIHTWLVKRP